MIHDADLQTLRLRGILEWRDEVTSSYDSSSSDEVMILIWPAGNFRRLPRGTTASEIVHVEVCCNMQSSKCSPCDPIDTLFPVVASMYLYMICFDSATGHPVAEPAIAVHLACYQTWQHLVLNCQIPAATSLLCPVCITRCNAEYSMMHRASIASVFMSTGLSMSI